MSRLDRHVDSVRNKMAAGTFLGALAWTLLGWAAVVWLNLLVDRFLGWRLPAWQVWLWAGLGAAVALAVAYTVWRRPSRQQAAVAIDQRLGLQEKFSTALYARPMNDPFAAAAVRDAEVTADNVSLHKRFPLRIPRTFAGTAAMALVALLTSFLGQHLLFARDPVAQKQAGPEQDKSLSDTRRIVNEALAKIEATPETAANREHIEAARKEVLAHKANLASDPGGARQSALKAMSEMDLIQKERIKDTQRFALDQDKAKAFQSLGKPADENSPVGKVQSELAKGKFSDAVEDLKDVVKKFDRMDKKEQEKAARDMSNLAEQLKAMAQDPSKQQQAEKALQKMGADSQQLKQLAQAVQAAANGDPQAQQQVGQMAKQIAQGINGGNSNLTPQQQQQVVSQVDSLVKQMQGAANNQATAKQMAGAAGAMAQAMKNKAGQNGQAGQPGGRQAQANGGQGGNQPGNSQGNSPGGNNPSGGQQANSGQPGGQQGGQPGGQQGGQPGGNQPGQGGQPGGQGGQPGGQGVADAAGQMQQQLEQLQQAADDAAAVAQQQQEQGGQGGQDGQGGQEGQGGKGNGNGAGRFAQGDPQPGGQGGQGGAAISAGGPRPRRPKPRPASSGSSPRHRPTSRARSWPSPTSRR